MTTSAMDEWDYERLKRRNHDLVKRARDVVEEARRIHQEQRPTPTPGGAWNSRIAGMGKAGSESE